MPNEFSSPLEVAAEAELRRAAVRHIAMDRANWGMLKLRALVEPDVESELRQLGILW